METNQKLNRKIRELKARSIASERIYMDTPINARALSSRANKDYYSKKLDERVICGYLVTWANRNHHGEQFVNGSWASTIQKRGPKTEAEYKLTFLYQHRQDDPLAVFDVVEEDDFGVYFETKALDDVPNGDRTVKQIKSRTLNQFSAGFDYVWDKGAIEYREKDDTLILLNIEGWEGSVVTIASDQKTKALRNFETINNLQGEIQDFILTLPKENRAIACELFERSSANSLDLFVEKEIETRGIDYSWLTSEIKNLKF